MKKIQAVLQENEQVLHTSKASLKKMLSFLADTVWSAGTFVATGIPSAKGKRQKVDRGLLEIYLVLTNQRLMLWKTTWYGRPKELYMSIELQDIKAVKLKFIKMFWTLPSVDLILNNDQKIGFWSAKVHKKRTLRLLEELEKRIK